MKISTRGRYGLKAIIDLAANSEGKCITLRSISERIGVSENYLEQIIAPLKKAGYVDSVRGAQGGYKVSRDLSAITVGDILRVLEGDLSPVVCLQNDIDDTGSCGNGGCEKCVTRPVWEEIYNSLNNTVDSITLEKLVNDYREVL